MSVVKTSRLISYILRHDPQSAGVTLDEHGWASVSDLIEGVNRTRHLTLELLERIVAEDDKGRYAFNADKTKIRANQGHSVSVDVELTCAAPPAVLYHGSAEKYAAAIAASGLEPKTRLYVHLSADRATAVKVGSRHGVPVVYEVDAARMQAEGYEFYLSVNGVWLTKHVPTAYLKSCEGED